MLHFENDYSSSCHPEILIALSRIGDSHYAGYGRDEICNEAERRILHICNIPEGRVYFLVGGTQTNAIVIDALLRGHQGVVCVKEGHIAVHEAGAIEACGHKVITLCGEDGRINVEELRHYMEEFYADETHEHCVAPGMVYISQPTETGSLYTLEELTSLSEFCKEQGLLLYLDGARLLYALQSPANDVSLEDVARLTDVFYIGGTKAGMMFGEAVVVSDPKMLPHFFSLVKRRGGLLAKGWLLGLQFNALFESDLYRRIGLQGIRVAEGVKAVMSKYGLKALSDSPTNQQFFVLPNDILDDLRGKVGMSVIGKIGEDSTLVRLVADWSNTLEDVGELDEILGGIFNDKMKG